MRFNMQILDCQSSFDESVYYTLFLAFSAPELFKGEWVRCWRNEKEDDGEEKRTFTSHWGSRKVATLAQAEHSQEGMEKEASFVRKEGREKKHSSSPCLSKTLLISVAFNVFSADLVYWLMVNSEPSQEII